MKKKSLRPVHALLLLCAAIIVVAACGGNRDNVLFSTTDPTIFYAHSLAFRNDTTISMGANLNGQLGNNLTDGKTKYTPVEVVFPPATGISSVSAGGTHSLALAAGGSVYAWGNNGLGQLGDNTGSPTALPKAVASDSSGTSLANITTISAGGSHSLALKNDNTVWAWGSNLQGQLGADTSTVPTRSFAGQVSGLVNVAKISAGKVHNLAIISGSGQAMSWGNNVSGELGRITSSTTDSSPGNVVIEGGTTPLTGVSEIAAGGSHSLFLVGNTVWSCGFNSYGQLGLGGTDTTDRKSGVVQVTGLPAGEVPVAIAAGLNHSLALMQGGTVYAWGVDYYGQLGDRSQLYSKNAVTTAVQVLKVDGSPLTDIIKIVAIGNHNLAVDTSGQLWVWGENSSGQLGLAEEDTNDRNFATPLLPTATYALR